MYSLEKKSDYRYTIVLMDRPVGEVYLQDKKWRASVGKMEYAAPNRKKAVEHLLKQIIMLYAAKEFKEKHRVKEREGETTWRKKSTSDSKTEEKNPNLESTTSNPSINCL